MSYKLSELRASQEQDRLNRGVVRGRMSSFFEGAIRYACANCDDLSVSTMGTNDGRVINVSDDRPMRDILDAWKTDDLQNLRGIEVELGRDDQGYWRVLGRW